MKNNTDVQQYIALVGIWSLFSKEGYKNTHMVLEQAEEIWNKLNKEDRAYVQKQTIDRIWFGVQNV